MRRYLGTRRRYYAEHVARTNRMYAIMYEYDPFLRNVLLYAVAVALTDPIRN